MVFCCVLMIFRKFSFSFVKRSTVISFSIMTTFFYVVVLIIQILVNQRQDVKNEGADCGEMPALLTGCAKNSVGFDKIWSAVECRRSGESGGSVSEDRGKKTKKV